MPVFFIILIIFTNFTVIKFTFLFPWHKQLTVALNSGLCHICLHQSHRSVENNDHLYIV